MDPVTIYWDNDLEEINSILEIKPENYPLLIFEFDWLPYIDYKLMLDGLDAITKYGPLGIFILSNFSELQKYDNIQDMDYILNNIAKKKFKIAKTQREFGYIFHNFSCILQIGWKNWVDLKISGIMVMFKDYY
jgi:hypothetical protein